MTAKTLLSRKVQLAFGCAILALLVVGAISYRGIMVSSESDQWVRHTHEVLEQLGDLQSAMRDVESSDRGFVLTGEESYIESFHAGMAEAGQAEMTIGNLTVDNPVQQRRLPALEKLMAEKIAFGESVIDLRRTTGMAAAAEVIRAGSGQRTKVELEGAVREMQDEELRLLALRDADAKRRLAQTKNILALGTILGVLIAGAAGWNVQRDASVLVLAQDALHEGEGRFRTLANSIPQLAWMADEKGYIFWYNDRWFEYTGTTLAEMAGWGWQKVHHPDQVKRVVEKITKCFQTGELWEDTFPLRGKDGKYRVFLSRAVPIRDSKGKVLRWFGTNTDISETKESGAKHRGLLEAAPDAMVVVNQAGEIVLLNVQAEKQLGYHRDELVGQKVTNIIPEGFAERLIADGTRSAGTTDRHRD